MMKCIVNENKKQERKNYVMKKQYQTPEIEVLLFDKNESVLTNISDPNGNEGWSPDDL